MKRKTYRIVWEEDPSESIRPQSAQPSEERPRAAAEGSEAGPMSGQQQQQTGANPMPGAPNGSAESDEPHGSTEKTAPGPARTGGFGAQRPETSAAAGPFLSARPAEPEPNRAPTPTLRTKNDSQDRSPATPTSYDGRLGRLGEMYPAHPDAERASSGPSEWSDSRKEAGGLRAVRSELDRRQVGEMIDSRLASLRVYVLESDITDAQRSVKAVVEQASF